MSWSVIHQCWDCGRVGCKDKDIFEQAATDLNAIEHHGLGSVDMKCGNHRPKPRVGARVLFVPAKGENEGRPQPADVLRTSNETGALEYGRLDLFVIDGGLGYRVDNVPYSAKNAFGTYHFMD